MEKYYQVEVRSARERYKNGPWLTGISPEFRVEDKVVSLAEKIGGPCDTRSIEVTWVRQGEWEIVWEARYSSGYIDLS